MVRPATFAVLKSGTSTVRHIPFQHGPLCASWATNRVPLYRWVESSAAEVRALPLCGWCRRYVAAFAARAAGEPSSS